MTYGEMLVRSVTEWVTSNQEALLNAARLLGWLIGVLLAAGIIPVLVGWERINRMERKANAAAERWMGR